MRWALGAVVLGAVGCHPPPWPTHANAQRHAVVRAPFAPDTRAPSTCKVTLRFEEGVDRELRGVEVTARAELRFEAQAEGFALSQRLSDVAVHWSRGADGGVLEDPSMAGLLAAEALDAHVTDDGTFVPPTDPPVRASLDAGFGRPPVDGSSFAEEGAEDWRATFEGLFGRALREGDVTYVAAHLPSSSGPVGYVLEREVVTVGPEVALRLRCPARADLAKAPGPYGAALRTLEPPVVDPSLRCEGVEVLRLAPSALVRRTLELTLTRAGERRLRWTRDEREEGGSR